MSRSLLAALASLLAVTSALPSPVKLEPRQSKFPYGSEKVRGVNIGGWLLTEPWIAPSIYQGLPASVVDEYTMGQALGSSGALARLQPHWASFMTADDFSQIAANGLNHVRIPIGYWSVTPLDGDPYVQGAYSYLGQALDWAQAAGLKVMIDLHGAPGSQNGFDNSGHRGAINWNTGSTVSQTLAALAKIQADHAAHPAVSTIELLNEPMGPTIGMGAVQDFYTSGYNQLSGSTVVTFHDAFQGVNSWNGFCNGCGNILEDTHHYQVFSSGELQQDINGHVAEACGFGGTMTQSKFTTVCGEWTGAMTDCAYWLNGLGVGARYDGSYNYNGQGSSYIGSCDGLSQGTVDGLSADRKAAIRRYIEAQMDAYEKKDGWMFWTWKTEGAPEWDLRNLTVAGVFPNPPTARQYPGQCG